eukprot:scaffold20.g7664.t1
MGRAPLPILPLRPAVVPDYLDGTLAGDYGFDPLGLGSSPEQLRWNVQSEVFHGRTAMTAVAGILFTSYPGGKYFDFLGMSHDPKLFAKYKQNEITNGRLAMFAFVGFAAQYAATGKGPIDNLIDHLNSPFTTTFVHDLLGPTKRATVLVVYPGYRGCIARLSWTNGPDAGGQRAPAPWLAAATGDFHDLPREGGLDVMAFSLALSSLLPAGSGERNAAAIAVINRHAGRPTQDSETCVRAGALQAVWLRGGCRAIRAKLREAHDDIVEAVCELQRLGALPPYVAPPESITVRSLFQAFSLDEDAGGGTTREARSLSRAKVCPRCSQPSLMSWQCNTIWNARAHLAVADGGSGDEGEEGSGGAVGREASRSLTAASLAEEWQQDGISAAVVEEDRLARAQLAAEQQHRARAAGGGAGGGQGPALPWADPNWRKPAPAPKQREQPVAHQQRGASGDYSASAMVAALALFEQELAAGGEQASGSGGLPAPAPRAEERPPPAPPVLRSVPTAAPITPDGPAGQLGGLIRIPSHKEVREADRQVQPPTFFRPSSQGGPQDAWASPIEPMGGSSVAQLPPPAPPAPQRQRQQQSPARCGPSSRPDRERLAAAAETRARVTSGGGDLGDRGDVGSSGQASDARVKHEPQQEQQGKQMEQEGEVVDLT